MEPLPDNGMDSSIDITDLSISTTNKKKVKKAKKKKNVVSIEESSSELSNNNNINKNIINNEKYIEKIIIENTPTSNLVTGTVVNGEEDEETEEHTYCNNSNSYSNNFNMDSSYLSKDIISENVTVEELNEQEDLNISTSKQYNNNNININSDIDINKGYYENTVNDKMINDIKESNLEKELNETIMDETYQLEEQVDMLTPSILPSISYNNDNDENNHNDNNNNNNNNNSNKNSLFATTYSLKTSDNYSTINNNQTEVNNNYLSNNITEHDLIVHNSQYKVWKSVEFIKGPVIYNNYATDNFTENNNIEITVRNNYNDDNNNNNNNKDKDKKEDGYEKVIVKVPTKESINKDSKCGECGILLQVGFFTKANYCYYSGKYYCDTCFGHSKTIIPSRVLQNWDKGVYPVSIHSKFYLDSIYTKPILNINTTNPRLYDKVQILNTLSVCLMLNYISHFIHSFKRN